MYNNFTLNMDMTTDSPHESVRTGKPKAPSSLSFHNNRSKSSLGDVFKRCDAEKQLKQAESNRQKALTQGRRSGQDRTERLHSSVFLCRVQVGAPLPRQLTHHFEQSLVLLFELLVLVFNVIQVSVQ